MTEAALLASGDAPCNEVNYGWVKLLTESRVQFDIVERETKWEERYALVVLPENLGVDLGMASRLQAFIAGGGAVIAAHSLAVLAGTDKSWLEQYGLEYVGMSPFKPAYMVPKVMFTGEIPPYPYALYEGASQWQAKPPAETLAVLGAPLFQRSPEHYMSHQQTPFDHIPVDDHQGFQVDPPAVYSSNSIPEPPPDATGGYGSSCARRWEQFGGLCEINPHFGNQRVFGSVGHGTKVLVATRYGRHDEPNTNASRM